MGEYAWSLGTLLAGALLNTFLLGIVARQYILYYASRPNDSRWVRMTVHSLLVIDIVHSALNIYVIWFYIVQNFVNPANVNKPFWGYLITAIMETFSTVLTQNFLAHRLYCLNGRRPLYTLLLTLISFTLILGVLAFLKSIFSRADWGFVPKSQYLYVPWMILQVVTDIIISTSLAIEFRSFRTGAPRSDRVISILVRKAIQAGLFATIFITGAGCSWIFDLRRRVPSHVGGAIIMSVGRVYSHALLDTLLVRTNFREVFSEPANLTEIVARDLEILGFQPESAKHEQDTGERNTLGSQNSNSALIV